MRKGTYPNSKACPSSFFVNSPQAPSLLKWQLKFCDSIVGQDIFKDSFSASKCY